jgi:hypothetical protein
VTVEEVGVSREGLFKIAAHGGEGELKAIKKGKVVDASNIKPEGRSKATWPKKAKKFRYECRSGRNTIRRKSKATNTARAIA